MQVFTHTCTHAHTRIPTCARTHTHTHTHTNSCNQSLIIGDMYPPEYVHNNYYGSSWYLVSGVCQYTIIPRVCVWTGLIEASKLLTVCVLLFCVKMKLIIIPNNFLLLQRGAVRPKLPRLQWIGGQSWIVTPRFSVILSTNACKLHVLWHIISYDRE